MRNEDIEVFLEGEMKDLLKEGGSLLIECRESAKRKGSNWSGQWVCFAISKDGQRGILMTYRLKRRVFTTLHGISSFIIDLGFPTLVTTHNKGETVELWLDGRIRIRKYGDTANERSIS